MPRAQERVEAWVNEESPGRHSRHADLATGFTAGSWLGGYRLEEQVGAGGMAVVFRARDERLDRLVALKIMTPAMGSDEMFRQRFIRESRAAAAVDDPHIIPVYEAGEVGQVLFIAMRFVRGGDVRSLLRREGPLPPDRVASIISPVASALDAAHTAGLVHRDVKPANILLDRRPGRPDHVYLSDFGLSKSAEVSLGLTAAGQFLGTPDYTAPEQIEGLPVDGRTDQYALACAVFELLTGQAPFHRSESFAAIWAHLNKPPPSLAERRPELPPAADLVMAKALAKAQADRYQTCWEFADALRDALGLPPYHLGSASSPGLAGSSPGTEVPRGAGPSPVSVVSTPPAPGAAGADADSGGGPGPGDAPDGPPPGEDTEASEVYAARSAAAEQDQGQQAEDRQDSTPDDQPTDPGLQAIPADPDVIREEEPSPGSLPGQPGPAARPGAPAGLDRPPSEPDRAPAQPDRAAAEPDRAPAGLDRPPSEPDRAPAQPDRAAAEPDRAPAGLDRPPSEPDRAPAQPDRAAAEPDRAPAQPDHATAEPDRAQAGAPAEPAGAPAGPGVRLAGRPTVTPAQQPAGIPASRVSTPPREPVATPAAPPRTPASGGGAPPRQPAGAPARQGGTPGGPAVEPQRIQPARPAPPRGRRLPHARRPAPTVSARAPRPGGQAGRPGLPPPAGGGRDIAAPPI